MENSAPDLMTLLEAVRSRTRLFAHEATMIQAACTRYAASLGFEDPFTCPPSAYCRSRRERDELLERHCHALSKRQREVTKTLVSRLLLRAAQLGLVALDEPPIDPPSALKIGEVPDGLPFPGADGDLPEGFSLRDAMSAMERYFLQKALAESHSQSEAAERLGLNFNTFYAKLRRHDLYG